MNQPCDASGTVYSACVVACQLVRHNHLKQGCWFQDGLIRRAHSRSAARHLHAGKHPGLQAMLWVNCPNAQRLNRVDSDCGQTQMSTYDKRLGMYPTRHRSSATSRIQTGDVSPHSVQMTLMVTRIHWPRTSDPQQRGAGVGRRSWTPG